MYLYAIILTLPRLDGKDAEKKIAFSIYGVLSLPQAGYFFKYTGARKTIQTRIKAPGFVLVVETR